MFPFNIVPLSPSVAAGVYGLQLRDPIDPETAAVNASAQLVLPAASNASIAAP